MSQEQERTPVTPYLLAIVGICVYAFHYLGKEESIVRAAPVDDVAVSERAAPVATPPLSTPLAGPRRVVLVSVDGMSSALVDRMPHLKQMFVDGAGTLKTEVPRGHTTAISHAVLFTGADPSVNGVTCEPDERPCNGFTMRKGRGYHSPDFRWTPLKVTDTLFTAVEASGHKAVAAVQKGKLVGFFRPNGDETGIISTNNTARVVETGCEAVKDDDVRLVVLHFKMIDDAGHHAGWLSDRQYREADTIDGQLQQVRDCVDRANAASGKVSTVLIVTSDHGGTPGGEHCGRKFDNDDTELVPWVALGPGLKRGYEITARSDAPTTSQGTHPTMLLVDTVPTILALLGLPETSIPTLSKQAKPVEGIYASQ